MNPTTLVQTVRRPRVPDFATYLQSGVFAQLNIEATDRLSVIAAVRAGFYSYESQAASGAGRQQPAALAGRFAE